MAWNISCGSGRTRAYGGLGGNWFDENLGQQFIKTIHVVHAGDYVNSVQFTTTDGSLHTYGRGDKPGASTATFRFDFEAGERVQRMEFYVYRKESVVRFGGVAIVTSEKTAKIGPLKGEKYTVEFKQKDAKLVGFCGRAGDDLDSVGFHYYLQCTTTQMTYALPEQCFKWKSRNCGETSMVNLYQPLQTVKDLEMSTESGRVVGICAVFEDGTSRSAGRCKDVPDMCIQLPVHQLIKYFELHESEEGYLNALNFYTASRNSQLDRTVDSAGIDKSLVCEELNAKLAAVQCGLSGSGEIDSLTLSFTNAFKRIPFATLPTVDMSAEESDCVLEHIDTDQAITRLILHSDDNEAVRGVRFMRSDRKLINCGDVSGQQLSVIELPNSHSSVDVDPNPVDDDDDDTEFSLFEEPERSIFSGMLTRSSGSRQSGDRSAININNLRGPAVGAESKIVGSSLQLNLITPSEKKLTTPLYGSAEHGVFYETDCVYKDRALSKQTTIGFLEAWFDKKLQIMNGFRTHEMGRAPSMSQGVIYSPGVFNGEVSRIDMCQFKRISGIQVFLTSDKKTRINGIKILGSDSRGRKMSSTLGQNNGIKHHYSVGFPCRGLSGIFGMCDQGIPSAIGFVLSYDESAITD